MVVLKIIGIILATIILLIGLILLTKTKLFVSFSKEKGFDVGFRVLFFKKTLTAKKNKAKKQSRLGQKIKQWLGLDVFDKEELKCGIYSKEENDLLDKILKDRINDAGYKTRAGAVEAARFLSMEFPYRIRYFSENGREATNGVQGEGRYYNEGLYLDESRFVNIKKPLRGPQPWGCQLWSDPSEGYRANGLDCSGFVSWAFLNGGFDMSYFENSLNVLYTTSSATLNTSS